jgi:hypothetical protein
LGPLPSSSRCGIATATRRIVWPDAQQQVTIPKPHPTAPAVPVKPPRPVSVAA